MASAAILLSWNETTVPSLFRGKAAYPLADKMCIDEVKTLLHRFTDSVKISQCICQRVSQGNNLILMFCPIHLEILYLGRFYKKWIIKVNEILIMQCFLSYQICSPWVCDIFDGKEVCLGVNNTTFANVVDSFVTWNLDLKIIKKLS